MPVVIASGVTTNGDRELPGVDLGDSESGPLWMAFFKGLRARGLTGVELVISDHHNGPERRPSPPPFVGYLVAKVPRALHASVMFFARSAKPTRRKI